MRTPLISVIIPVYNVEKYLTTCLDSMLKQTYQYFEIILVNDGSFDRSAAICREYAQKDQRILLIEQSNQGLSAARNAGLQVARGEYLTFLDSDDLFLPNALEVMQESITKYHADICICGCIMKNSVRQVTVNHFQEPTVFDKNALVLQYISTSTIPPTACAKMFRSHLFEELVFPIGKINEDAFIMPSLLHRANRAVCVPESLYIQNLREGSIMRSKFSLKNLDIIACEENTMQFIATNYPQWSDRVVYLKFNAIASIMSKILMSHVYKQYRELYHSLHAMLLQEYSNARPLVTPNTKIVKKYMVIIQHPLLFRIKFYIRGLWQKIKNLLKCFIRAIRR